MLRAFYLAMAVTGFVAAVAFWPGILDFATAPRWAGMAVLLPLCLMLCPDSPAVHRPGVYAAVVITLLAAALSLLWTLDAPSALDDMAQMFILAAAFCLGLQTLSLLPLWIGMTAGIVVSCVLVGFQTMGYEGLPQSVAPAGLFANKNLFAESLVVAAAALPAWPGLIAAAVLTTLLGARGALVGLATVAAVWLFPKRPYHAAAVITLAAIGAVALLFTGDVSTTVRLGYWHDAIDGLTFFGNGLGSWASSRFDHAEFVHNDLLQSVYELGLFALVPVAVVIYALGGDDVHTGRSTAERGVLAGVIGCSLFGFPFHLPLTGVAASAACGALVRRRLDLRQRVAPRSVEGCACA